MYSYSSGDALFDAQAERLFADIDKQLDRWNNKYGPRNLCAAPEKLQSVGRNTHADEAAACRNTNSKSLGRKQRSAASSPTHHGGSSNSSSRDESIPTSYLNEELKLEVSALVARVSLLEGQLQVAESERAVLRNRLDAAQQQMSELIEAHKSLQNECIAFRTQALSSPPRDAAQERARDETTHPSAGHSAHNRCGSSGTCSGPLTVASTELVSPHAVTTVLGPNFSGEASDAGLGATTALRKSSAQERKMALEQLARRLHVSLTP
ncbi:uncharacterized protein Tco025E_08987 [Trypanosoma conorhini]|uniref:Uncharacterized protein n=1 Tax=Trypanosoma conorhini TaxID=83891 RepID=A0A3R7K008_9TRYP|nr:uncharacterized protein Tco025E_08987 [Trypanosoma conorhini]RNE99548.1 hypothetical protein Tco025E_08987 [Trypanosoma conorhini]